MMVTSTQRHWVRFLRFPRTPISLVGDVRKVVRPKLLPRTAGESDIANIAQRHAGAFVTEMEPDLNL